MSNRNQNNLQKLLNSRNLTHLELANKVNVTRMTIQKIASGEQQPRVELAIRISKIFDKQFVI